MCTINEYLFGVLFILCCFFFYIVCCFPYTVGKFSFCRTLIALTRLHIWNLNCPVQPQSDLMANLLDWEDEGLAQGYRYRYTCCMSCQPGYRTSNHPVTSLTMFCRFQEREERDSEKCKDVCPWIVNCMCVLWAGSVWAGQLATLD